MGDPRKLTKKYSTPSKLFDKSRIIEEKRLVREYGLKNMRELWRAMETLRKIRRQARRLQALGEEATEAGKPLMNKLQRLGLAKPDSTLDDLLGLTVSDILDRRLQTIVYKKGMARTIKQARQLIVHGFIAVNGQKVSRPSYMVRVDEENNITYTKPIDINAGVIKENTQEEAQASEPQSAETEAS